MAEYARKPDVKLNIDTKLEDRANLILSKGSIKDDLIDFEKKIKQYIAGNKSSKAKDWTGDDALIKYPELKNIRNRHFHFSSKPGMGYSPNFTFDIAAGKTRRTRYEYNDSEDSWVRHEN